MRRGRRIRLSHAWPPVWPRRPATSNGPGTDRAPTRHPEPRWRAGQAGSGGWAGLELPDSSGAGGTLFIQQTRHSKCGRSCRPCSCSHAKCAAPARSSTLTPPPKGSPAILGNRRSIAVHLPITNCGVIGGDCTCNRPVPL
jgi:hypothetical protein